MKQTKASLVANITQDLSDNATQDITPRDVRQNLIDIIDSIGNLLFTEQIVSTNFATQTTRTTIAGEDVLSKLGQESYVSVDNSAFGYAALKQNFRGERNTALGAYSLTCNVYGTDNVAVGYSALAGNSNGVANVGIGEYTLYYNKLGNMNVAIGHGAGYYADRESSSKLYIGVHPVTEQYICDNPEGVGLTPLVHGDFVLEKFGVNVNDFHPYGSVQVSGAISPSEDQVFDLGHTDYSFNIAHARGISFSEGVSNTYDPLTDAVLVSGVQMHSDDIKPLTSNVYSLGSPSNVWRNTHTHDLNVYGTANINELNTITSCLYECKTLYLATSGVCEGETSPCGYLPESLLVGAGLVIPSSGDSGLSNFKWTLTPSGLSTRSLAPQPGTLEDNAYWTSNNNILLSGDYSHIRASKYVGLDNGKAAFGGMISNAGNGFGGMNVDTDATYQRLVFTTNDGFFDSVYNSLERAGAGDFGSFYSNYTFSINSSAEDTNPLSTEARRVTISSPDLDVPVSLNFNHGNSHKRGAEIYSTASGAAQGLFISTYDGSNSSNPDINTVSIMQDDATGGVLGVHNFTNGQQVRLPETIINARSSSDASIRVTAENAGNVSAALELCGELNCLQDAGEIVYNKQSGVMMLSTYKDSGRLEHITLNQSSIGRGFGIYNTNPANNNMVNIGSDDDNIGIALSNFPENYLPLATTGFTTLIAREVDDIDQKSELVYVDSVGNSFPLSLVTDNSRSLFGDDTNLFGGSGCPSNRSDVLPASGNTGYGAEALSSTSSSGPCNVLNTAIGYKAGYGLAHSSGNVVVGSESIVPAVSGVNNNIVLGNNAVVSGSNNLLIGNSIDNVASSNNIVIGPYIDASGLPNSTFLLGGGTNVLLSGVLNSANPVLSMPSDGSFRLYDSSNIESTSISHHKMQVAGSGTRYGTNPFVISFAGEEGLKNDVMTLDHSAHYGMNNSEEYETTNPRRPFVHINGDLQVRGALRLPDGSSLTSATAVNSIEVLIAELQEQIDVQTIEGTMLQDVDSPPSPLAPNQGTMSTFTGETVTIVLRDIYLRLEEGDYVIASRIKTPTGSYEYRPVWVSNEYATCGSSRPPAFDGGTV